MTIDSVHLHIKDYSVTPDTRVEVTPSSYVAGTGELLADFPLYRNTQGKDLVPPPKAFGARALTILPLVPTEKAQVALMIWASGSTSQQANSCSMGLGRWVNFGLASKEPSSQKRVSSTHVILRTRTSTTKSVRTTLPLKIVHGLGLWVKVVVRTLPKNVNTLLVIA